MRGREHLARSAMRLGLGRRQALSAVEALFGTVAETLHEGGSVSIVGFGSWEWTERAARQAHDPRNMRTVELPERRKLVFKPSKSLKQRVQEGIR